MSSRPSCCLFYEEVQAHSKKKPSVGSSTPKWKYKFGHAAGDSVFWADGYAPLANAKPKVLRSIAMECRTNDNKRWCLEYEYVASAAAMEGCWCFAGNTASADGEQGKVANLNWPKIRDCGNGGKTLSDFVNHPAAKAAKLSVAEVALLRLYMGPLYEPLNGNRTSV
jgi:hypothetical protein